MHHLVEPFLDIDREPLSDISTRGERRNDVDVGRSAGSSVRVTMSVCSSDPTLRRDEFSDKDTRFTSLPRLVSDSGTAPMRGVERGSNPNATRGAGVRQEREEK
jgi:hypothetical protein